MNIDRDQILQLLHSQGDTDKAEQAGNELPGQIDTDNPDHQNLLQKFGLNPMQLVAMLGGLGGAGGNSGNSGNPGEGGLGGMLGKLL